MPIIRGISRHFSLSLARSGRSRVWSVSPPVSTEGKFFFVSMVRVYVCGDILILRLFLLHFVLLCVYMFVNELGASSCRLRCRPVVFRVKPTLDEADVFNVLCIV